MTLIKDIYKSIFGKNYSALWQQFAKENQGTYAPVNNERVLILYKDFTLTFEAYTHYTVVGGSSYEAEYTRGTAEFTSPDDFKLVITRQDFLDKISKLFGSQDIEAGDKEFDKKFMIKSNDEAKTLLILSNPKIFQHLQDLPTLRLQVTDGEGLWNEKPQEGNRMLYFALKGELKHIDELNKIHQLFCNTLDSLTKLSFIKGSKHNF